MRGPRPSMPWEPPLGPPSLCPAVAQRALPQGTYVLGPLIELSQPFARDPLSLAAPEWATTPGVRIVTSCSYLTGVHAIIALTLIAVNLTQAGPPHRPGKAQRIGGGWRSWLVVDSSGQGGGGSL